MGTNKRFDEFIKQKLDQLDLSGQPMHWDALRKKLDQAAVPASSPDAENKLDQLLARKLHHVPVPGSPSSAWAAFDKKRRERTILKEQVLFFKSLEMSLFLFFAILLWQGRIKQPVLTPPQEFRQTLTDPVATRADKTPSTSTLTRNASAASSKAPATPDGIPTSTDVAPAPSTAAAILPPEDRTEATAGKTSKRDMLAIQAITPKVLQEESGNASIAEIAFPGKLQENLRWSMPAIAMPNMPMLSVPGEDQEEGVFELKPAPKRAILNIAMLGGADYNRVMTPPDYRYRIQGFDRYTMGYGGGLLFGLEYGRMEVGTGLVYSAKQYRPLPVIFIKGNFKDGYVGESLQNVQLNLINLPFYVRYDALRKDKWRAYITGGASLQIAFEANYFISPPTALPPDLNQTPVPQSRLRNRTEGWFEGGAFKENSYVTANLGIGVERFLSERWGIFVQPTYHQSIGYFSNGLGPNLDRIHTLSLWTGIRVRVLD